MFRVAPSLEMKKIEEIFRHKVFKMLLAKGRITRDLIAMLSNWRHSGFQVICGNRIGPEDETGMENLVRYIIWASFSQERMQYLEETSRVVYRAKDGTEEKVFDAPVSSTGQALEWLAAMPACACTHADRCSHIPDRGESRVSRDLPVESKEKPKTTGSPASWKPIKVRRNTGKTGPG